jgi:hypothetical protein
MTDASLLGPVILTMGMHPNPPREPEDSTGAPKRKRHPINPEVYPNDSQDLLGAPRPHRHAVVRRDPETSRANRPGPTPSELRPTLNVPTADR